MELVVGVVLQPVSHSKNSMASLLKALTPGFTVKEVYNIGTTVGSYTPTGVPDGIGAFLLPDERTRRILVNSEIGTSLGSSYALANGTSLVGARISYLDVKDGAVVASGLAYDKIYDRFGTLVTKASQVNELAAGAPGVDTYGFERFCSANLVEANPFGAGKGPVDRIFLLGEEQDNGQAVVLDVAGNALWVAPDLGRGGWESATALDTGSTTTVAYLLGDDGPNACPLYLYVGTKTGTDFLGRNGLKGGQLYVWKPTDSTKTNHAGIAVSTTAAGSWVALNAKDATKAGQTGYDSQGYKSDTTLRTEAAALGAWFGYRVEDVDVNPNKFSQVAFNTTGGTTANTLAGVDDVYGSVWTMDLTFGSDGKPAASTIKHLYNGDVAGLQVNGLRSPDNLDWSADGNLYVNEDKSTSATAWGTQEASVWKLNPTTGVAERFIQVDRNAALPTGQAESAASKAVVGNWETSGIQDVSNLYGHPAGTDFFLDVQAHGVTGGTIDSLKLVEGGQIDHVTSARTFTRLLDPLTGQHLQTADASEVAAASGAGWKAEGSSFSLAPVPASLPTSTGFNVVSRLYHSNGDHLLTTSASEIAAAKQIGYRLEGEIGTVSAGSTANARQEIQRLFKYGQHFYTDNSAESASLIASGWSKESSLGWV